MARRCAAGRNQVLKLMPNEPISILFLLIRSQTLISSSRRFSMLGVVASILIVAVPLWPRTRTFALTEMRAQDPLEHAIALRGRRDFT
jgi:hypothetical protein